MSLDRFHFNPRLTLLFLLLAAIAFAEGGRHLIKKIPIAGDYGWDYLTSDSDARRLYVSHGQEVVVIDLDTEAVIGNIPGSDVHGIAIAKEFGRGFISCTDPGSVVIFDLKTLAVIERVPVGADPNVILFDHKTKRIFTADRGSKRVTALDPKTGKVIGTIEGLGGKTEHATSDDAGHVFLNMQDLNTMLKLDSQGLKVLETWPMAPCEQPSAMDMDRVHGRVFVGCRSGLMAVVASDNGRIVATNPIGRGVDAAEFDAARGLVYFSSGDGTMAVFHEDTPDKYTLVDNVKTQTGARTMAIDRKSGRAFLSAARRGPLPESTTQNPSARAPIIPGSFSVLVFGEQ
jgi:DNA-binding beta-propeller fold protein YncE